jgi:hypothetical protein
VDIKYSSAYPVQANFIKNSFILMAVHACYTKKCIHFPTQKCVLHREPNLSIFSKPNNFRKSQEENKFLLQRIKELEEKVDALKSDAKRRKLFSATVKKETKHILAPETQYRPDSPRLESRSQVLAPETQDGPDSPPLESQPKGLAPETQNGPDSSPLESQSQGLAPELLYGPDSQPLESQSVLGKCKQYVAKKNVKSKNQAFHKCVWIQNNIF